MRMQNERWKQKSSLTERELQIAELLAWGASKKEVPGMLQKIYGGHEISVHTVENIARNIYAKLHLNKASELSAWYFCNIHHVDPAGSPFRKLRSAVYSIVFLLILLPTTLDLDQALRPQRVRTTRVERVVRSRKKD